MLPVSKIIFVLCFVNPKPVSKIIFVLCNFLNPMLPVSKIIQSPVVLLTQLFTKHSVSGLSRVLCNIGITKHRTGLSSSCVLLTQCCQCLWIIESHCNFVFPMSSGLWIIFVTVQHCDNKTRTMLPVTLALSFVLCFVIPMLPVTKIIFVLCFVNPMLPVSRRLSSSCVLGSQCCQ